MSAGVVNVEDLTVRIPLRSGAVVHAVTDAGVHVERGRLHALIGESGCGKSMIARTLTGTLPRSALVGGTARVEASDSGYDLVAFHDRVRRSHGVAPSPPSAGGVVALVPQSAATFLTPVRTTGSQLAETCRQWGCAQSPAELCERSGLDRSALQLYPHQLSGGMAQRAAVAFALAGDPEVVVADEPTAALDPELKTGLFRLLRELADAGTAVLLITHDLAELEEAGVADDVSVMYASRIVETGPARRVLGAPEHPYSRALRAALPAHGMVPVPGVPPEMTDLDPGHTFADRVAAAQSTRAPEAGPAPEAVRASRGRAGGPWSAREVTVAFAGRTVLDGACLDVAPGEIVGLRGPSGSGETTLARAMCGVLHVDSGEVTCAGVPVGRAGTRRGRPTRGRIAMLFQSPRLSCDPRMSLRRIVAEPRDATADAVAAAARQVGLTQGLLTRRPAQVSDGQLQRAALARTLVARPDFLVCDELTAMLDPGTAAQTMAVLTRLARESGTGVLVVSHDPVMLERVADRVVTMEQVQSG